MVIIAGSIEFDPATRDAFVAGTATMVAASRAEEGCMDYSFSVDPTDPGRVRLFEWWKDNDALVAHRATPHMAAFKAFMGTMEPRGLSLSEFDATQVPRTS
jgi:quinol monooxygenase YgiN